MSRLVRVTASFTDLPPFLEALRRLRSAGVERFAVYSPVPLDEYEHLMPRQGSPIRWYALVAGVLGCVSGFALCLGASRFFSLIVGGKPVASWVPFCVIAFELTILTAALVTMGAALGFPRLFPRSPGPGYDPSFSVDAFGLSVLCAEDRREAVAELLREAGAHEVRESEEPPPGLWARFLRPDET